MTAATATVEERRGFTRPTWLSGAVALALLVVLWQLVGAAHLLKGTIPPPTKIISQCISDGWSFYWPNMWTTLREASQGWLWGNGIAILLAFAIVLVPLVERPVMQVAIAAFCLPILAIGPILQILFDGDTPKIVLSALTCFFTTLIGMVVGLRSADRSSLELIKAYGGGPVQQLYKVRLRASLPSLFAGLRIAAPTAILGAIIGEYLGGENGLGIAMISSQQGLQIARTWGLTLVTTALAGIAYAITAVIGRMATSWMPRTSS